MAYIGNQPVPQATQTRDRFTATSGQTSFATSGYTPGFLDVYLNGVHLDASDYTATNGSDVVLASGAASGDVLEVVAYSTFETADLVSKVDKSGDTMTGALTTPSITTTSSAVFGGHDGAGPYVQAIVRNTQLPPTAGAVGQTATIDFELGANDGGVQSFKQAARLEAFKDGADWDTGSASANFQGGLKVYTLKNEILTNQVTIGNDGEFAIDAGYGSVEPIYGVRAWLYYSGDANTIYASRGVSSVTKNGVGDYTLNFSFAFPDTNYIMVAESFDGGGQNDLRDINSSFNAPGKTTTQHQFYALGATTGTWAPALDDSQHIQIIVVR